MSRYRIQVREVVNAFLPVCDGGVDFILYREVDSAIRNVKPNSQWMIHETYMDGDIGMAFPVGDVWHLTPHDEMLRLAEAGGTITTTYWAYGGTYLRPWPSASVIDDCIPCRFASIATVAAEAVEQDVP